MRPPLRHLRLVAHATSLPSPLHLVGERADEGAKEERRTLKIPSIGGTAKSLCKTGIGKYAAWNTPRNAPPYRALPWKFSGFPISFNTLLRTCCGPFGIPQPLALTPMCTTSRGSSLDRSLDPARPGSRKRSSPTYVKNHTLWRVWATLYHKFHFHVEYFSQIFCCRDSCSTVFQHPVFHVARGW